jgi:hypothetical protein
VFFAAALMYHFDENFCGKETDATAEESEGSGNTGDHITSGRLSILRYKDRREGMLEIGYNGIE